MDSSTSSLDNPKTLSIRRGQTLEAASAEAQPLPEQPPVVEPVGAAEPVVEADPGVCPRCKGKLINPQELGWCPKCGYCRSLEKDKATARLTKDVPQAKSAFDRFGEVGELIGKIPKWGWIAAGGVCAIVAIASLLNYVLPKEDSLARALISLISLVASIVTILFVNLWSLFQLGADNEHLGPKDVFLCASLWKCICAKLPATRRPFWTGTWCLTALICSIFIVGGFEYWWDLYKPKKLAKKELLSAVSALGQGADENKSLEDSIRDLASKQDLTANALKEKLAPTQVTQCVIVGYTVDGDNELNSLLVAALLNDRVRYAGIVRKGWDPKKAAELLVLLKPLQQPKSYVPGLTQTAIWVKPAVFCEIAHMDFDKDKHFINPLFKDILSGN